MIQQPHNSLRSSIRAEEDILPLKYGEGENKTKTTKQALWRRRWAAVEIVFFVSLEISTCSKLRGSIVPTESLEQASTISHIQDSSPQALLKPWLGCVRPRPNYPREIWKRCFISLVRPTVHTNPARKRSFTSTVRPTIHTNPSRKRSFTSTVRPTVHTNPARKRSFTSEYWLKYSAEYSERFVLVLNKKENALRFDPACKKTFDVVKNR